MAGGARPAVLLDRDGVINELCTARGPRETPRTADELALLPGAQEALRQLRRAGVPLVVVTNQPNVAKGKSTWAEAAAIEARLKELLGPAAALDAVYTCFHHPDPAQVVVRELLVVCECRKPKPGLLLQAASEHTLNLRRSVMVGDSGTDVAAGQNAGCHTVRLRPPGAAREAGEPLADAEANDLLAAVPYVLQYYARQ